MLLLVCNAYCAGVRLLQAIVLLEAETRVLRADAVQQSEKHQQQLVQLGALREEEKLRSEHDHQAEVCMGQV